MPAIPALFLERMANYLGDEYPAFEAALLRPAISALRVNTLKLSPGQFQANTPFPLGEPVPWCRSAFVMLPALHASPSSRSLPQDSQDWGPGESAGKHPFHLAGLYYLQDPSAMAAVELLDPQPGERILDLAAAPGGKATHIASLMAGEGLLVANEIKTRRVDHLALNMERWGAANVIVTNESPERLVDHFGAFFDRVLVDAPCSGEGMFRKDLSARQDWSLEMVAGCAARQSNILRIAAGLVRPGGLLLYATCTFASEENEGVIARFLLDCPGFEIVPLPHSPAFMPGRPEWLPAGEQNSSLQFAVRLWPHRSPGEGHFICMLRRESGSAVENLPGCRAARLSQMHLKLWRSFACDVLAAELPEDRLRIFGNRLYSVPAGTPDLGRLKIVHPGVWLGVFKKDRFEPAHPLALFLSAFQVQNIFNLPAHSPALAAYLHGESLPSQGKPGWTVVAADGYPLGWGKRVHGVLKNRYPRGWLQV